MKLKEPLYFGCVGRPGHYVFTPDLRHSDDTNTRWLSYLDGKLPPDDSTQTQGIARLHHFVGCTLIAFWDRSVDKRGGCNSVFALPGKLTFEQARDAAQRAFPNIWNRFGFPVVLAEEPK